ncbi:MAG: hypothetical protein K8F52_08805 [Candidatus Scalindua rubra]|uniref:RAMP superfamily protein n=1 Tax=Candidatus Scalindua brodae TaxID=237368 RepID=A0A0B0EHC4_9BACT|nr:MAG: RAMP superfamily protein [Candidatus Scalindua brodae]MBZ0108758.1 hypothetical protein [Candidatus Scalindua rubra]TWU30945.1 RAMP superfamily protein [Candidatus Brocadiaceae bacterium S225]
MGYQLKVVLKSPVCIAMKKGVGNMIETIDYIPGNTIRGALAMHYLEEHGTWDQEKRIYVLPEDNDEFNTIFNSDTMCFHNAYIDGKKVVPLTASSCKYQSGFEEANNIEDFHGVRDTLVELVKYELTGGFDKDDKDKFDRCGRCPAPMDRFRGYYGKKSPTASMYETGAVERRFIARSALNDTFEAAAAGKLYTIEVIDERQTFIAELNKALFDKLKPLFDEKIIRIGRAKSRGFGEVLIRVEKTIEDNEHSLSHFFESFNGKMYKFIGDKSFFSVTLLSDVILLDDILRFKSTITINNLVNTVQDITPEGMAVLNKFKLLRGILSTRIVSEWDHALKLPREDSLSIAKGSVFVFMSEGLSDSEKELLVTVLGKIENTGIGEQRNKGYGRIRFCDEFHWEDEVK